MSDVTETDIQFMQRALALAKQADIANEVPVGAVVVQNGEVIGEAHNSPISTCDPSAHAEILALRDASKHINNYRLTGATLYVTLEPCVMCVGAILHARIGRLVYGASEPKTGAVSGRFDLLQDERHYHSLTVVSGVCEQDSVDLIQAFFKRRRAEKRATPKPVPPQSV